MKKERGNRSWERREGRKEVSRVEGRRRKKKENMGEERRGKKKETGERR
jgi:hypothetical protein